VQKAVLLLFLFLSFNGFGQKSEFQPYSAFIDSVEDGQYLTVFNKPGMNWSTCTIQFDKVTKAEKCKEAVGWPSRDAKIKVISPPVKAKVFNPYIEEEVEENYVKVEFEYTRTGKDGKEHHQKGEGYIELAYLSRSVRNPFYGAQNSATKQPDCDKNKNPQAQLKDLSKQIAPLAKSIENLSISKKAEEISKVVGFCPLNPATKKPAYTGKENVYDHFILPGLKKKRLPQVKTEKGEAMTQAQLIEIDSMARTLYGEMAQCYKHGLQYPLAVAKIIQNRKNSNRDREFIKPPQAIGKPKTAQVATTPSQFSMWHKTIAGKKNNPLHHGLCPPQKPGQPFWRSKSTPKQENDICVNTVRIATEAVLHPKEFERRTTEITGFHYSSGMSDRPNAWMKKMQQVNPSIQGRKIERDACLEIWME
jgi:hypothetical protein